jgi:hypothetical protein
MIVSSQSGLLLDSALKSQATRENVGVAVLKKAENAAKTEGDAMVRMLEQSGAPAQTRPPLLDTYA